MAWIRGNRWRGLDPKRETEWPNTNSRRNTLFGVRTQMIAARLRAALTWYCTHVTTYSTVRGICALGKEGADRHGGERRKK